MKKFIKYFMFLFVGALLAITAVSLTSCDQFRREKQLDDDSVFKAKVDAYLPIAMQRMYLFDNPTDVVLYKQERQRQETFDSVLLSLPDQTIANICSVLKKQQSQFGVSDIVYEYNTNSRIYNALPPQLQTDDPPSPERAEKADSDSLKLTKFAIQL